MIISNHKCDYIWSIPAVTSKPNNLKALHGFSNDRTSLFFILPIIKWRKITLISVYLLLRLLGLNIGDNAFFDQEIFKIARLMHVKKNIAATNKISLDVDLGNCRPFRILFNTFSELSVLKNIESFDLAEINTLNLHDLDSSTAEATLYR